MRPSLYYELHGDSGPFLLLVHGMLSSRAQWILNLDALSEVCRPIVVELLGHARSPTPNDPVHYSPEHYVEEFEAIRKLVGAEKWFICGQSLGATMTLLYSLEYPDRVMGQIFTNSNSALADGGWAERVLPLMEAQSRLLESDGRRALDDHRLNPARGRRLPAQAREALVADFALHTVRGIANTGLYTVPPGSVRERAAEIEVPTMLVVGEREEGFAEARRFAGQTIPGITIVELDAGHAVNLEAAGEFNRVVIEFIRSLTPA